MAKMFYSLEEAASKLKKSETEVRGMAAKGEITEFRDGDRLIFKVDQINLLAGDDESDLSSMIPLSDSGAGGTGLGLGLADSSVAGKSGGGDAKERTGISVFDADELEVADASAQTQMSDDAGLDGVNLENFGSGSGLMELTRESDDTSLGASALLEGGAGAAAGAAGGHDSSEGGLFEGGIGAGSELASPAMAMVAAEAYDAKGSGLAGGLAVGAVISLALGLAVTLMGMAGAAPGAIGEYLKDMNLIYAIAGLLVLTVALGGIGFAVSKK